MGDIQIILCETSTWKPTSRSSMESWIRSFGAMESATSDKNFQRSNVKTQNSPCFSSIHAPACVIPIDASPCLHKNSHRQTLSCLIRLGLGVWAPWEYRDCPRTRPDKLAHFGWRCHEMMELWKFYGHLEGYGDYRLVDLRTQRRKLVCNLKTILYMLKKWCII